MLAIVLNVSTVDFRNGFMCSAFINHEYRKYIDPLGELMGG